MVKFSIFSIRFERTVDNTLVLAETRPRLLPHLPEADWDAGRDGQLEFAAPTSSLAVVAPACERLLLNVRFLGVRPVQKWEVWASDPSSFSVLPEVAPQTIDERVPGCVSREFRFSADASRIAQAGVGRHEVTWQWRGQFIHPDGRRDPERDLGVTRLVIFSILGAPGTPPWRPGAVDDPDHDLLRPEVLDVACRMASGSATRIEAATAVTRAVFDLGSIARRSNGMRSFEYGDRDDFTCGQEHQVFLCDAFLSAVNERAGRRPVSVSCEDVATAVCVFANALGLDLERRMLRIPGGSLVLKPVRCIGSKPETSPVWDNHVVAWSPVLGGVFDACLQLNTSSDPGAERWETPAGMPLGEAAPHPTVPGYRHRLLARHPEACGFDKLCDPVLDRAPLNTCERHPIERRRAEFARLLRDANPSVALPPRLDAVDWPTPPGFALLHDSVSAGGWFAEASWERGQPSEASVGLSAELTPDIESARELAAWRLTFYREVMSATRNEDLAGAVTFATHDGRRILLLYANGVVQLRGDGTAPETLPALFGPVLGPVLTPPA